MQAPNAVPEADWSRRSTSSWLSRAPPLLVWTAGSARTQWTRGPPHSLAHRGRRCLRSHASAGIKSNVCVTALTSRRRLPQTLNTNAHAPASTTLVCANSMRRATIEADSPRRHGARARVYCARVQARSTSAGTCGPTTSAQCFPDPSQVGYAIFSPVGTKAGDPHRLCQAPARRGAVASGTAAPPAATRRSSIAVPAT